MILNRFTPGKKNYSQKFFVIPIPIYHQAINMRSNIKTKRKKSTNHVHGYVWYVFGFYWQEDRRALWRDQSLSVLVHTLFNCLSYGGFYYCCCPCCDSLVWKWLPWPMGERQVRNRQSYCFLKYVSSDKLNMFRFLGLSHQLDLSAQNCHLWHFFHLPQPLTDILLTSGTNGGFNMPLSSLLKLMELKNGWSFTSWAEPSLNPNLWLGSFVKSFERDQTKYQKWNYIFTPSRKRVMWKSQNVFCFFFSHIIHKSNFWFSFF